MYPVTSGAICLYAYRVLDGYHGAGVVLFVSVLTGLLSDRRITPSCVVWF